MNSLQNLQETMAMLLLSEAGHPALLNDPQWEAFLQNPTLNPHQVLSGTPKSKLVLYNRLIDNTLLEVLTNIYPFTHRFLKERWPRLAKHFRRVHPCSHYHLYRAVEPFSHYLAQQPDLVSSMPYLPELAQYEWLEVQIMNQEDSPLPIKFLPSIPHTLNDLHTHVPVWNPALILEMFSYPMDTMLAELIADESSETPPQEAPFFSTLVKTENICPMLIYRDPNTLKSRSFKVNLLTFHWVKLGLEKQKEHTQSYTQTFQHLKTCFPPIASVPEETLLSEGLALLQLCQKNHILLGSQPI